MRPMTVAELREALSRWGDESEVWVATPMARVLPVFMAGTGGPDSGGCADFVCLIAGPIAGAQVRLATQEEQRAAIKAACAKQPKERDTEG